MGTLLLLVAFLGCAHKEKVEKVEKKSVLRPVFNIEEKLAEIAKSKPDAKKIKILKVKKSSRTKKKIPKVEDRPFWEKFSSDYLSNETLVMRLKYFGIECGQVHLKIQENDNYFRFVADVKSAKFYRYIYSVDDRIESLVDKTVLRPLRYTLIQRESGQNVDDIQEFDWKNRLMHFRYKKIKKGKESHKNKKIVLPEFVQDTFSILYFVRGLPLKENDVYHIPVANREKIWTLQANVGDTVEISTGLGPRKAILVTGITHAEGPENKRGHINFWYSADRKRTLLKFEAKIKIGSVLGEIIQIL